MPLLRFTAAMDGRDYLAVQAMLAITLGLLPRPARALECLDAPFQEKKAGAYVTRALNR